MDIEYCKDDCPDLIVGECGLGFEINYRVPLSYNDHMQHNYGYVKARECRKKGRMKEGVDKVKEVKQ